MGQNPPLRPIINLRGITKSFSDRIVNDSIDLDIYKGEVHVLVGESGSGKTTLMNIMGGELRPDYGAMFVMGRKVETYSKGEAKKMGIAMIPRNPVIIPEFTVFENIILGNEPTKKFIVNDMLALERIEKISGTFGLKLNPTAFAGEASEGLKQRIEIAKAIYKGARILVFDDPTDGLTSKDLVEIFLIYRLLASRGRTIVITTNKLNDIVGIADRISVMRAGKIIKTSTAKQTDARGIAAMLFGKAEAKKTNQVATNSKNIILDILDLQFDEKTENSAEAKGITLSIGGGEILGLMELDNGGRRKLIEALTGYRKATKGQIKINGVDITNKTPDQIRKRKVAYFSKDEKKVRPIYDFTVTENITMGVHGKRPFAKLGIIDHSEVSRLGSALMNSFKIADKDKKTPVKLLPKETRSKVALASELYINPELLIVEHPSRGRETEVIELLYKYLKKMKENEKAVLLVSNRAQEALSLCDRIAVMCQGKIVSILDAKSAREVDIKLLLAGIKPNEENE